MNNYESLFEAVKNNYKEYESLTYEEFASFDDDEKQDFFSIIENVALDYFEGRDVSPEFEEALDSYYQEDNSKNNEFRNNFKKVFEFAIRKRNLGDLTFEDFLSLNENDPRRIDLMNYIGKKIKDYRKKKLDPDKGIYKVLDKFYNSEIFKKDGNDFKTKAPVDAESFFRYGSIFKAVTSKVRNENNGVEEENDEEIENAAPKKPNKVVKFAKDGTKTVGYTVLVSANALFGGLGVLALASKAVGWNIFIPGWFPALAIGVPVVTVTGLIIKNRKKIKNKVSSIISKVKNKLNIKEKDDNSDKKSDKKKKNKKNQKTGGADFDFSGSGLYDDLEDFDFSGVYDDLEKEETDSRAFAGNDRKKEEKNDRDLDEDTEKKNQQNNKYKDKLIELKNKLEMAKRLGKEDWIAEIEHEIVNLERNISKKDKQELVAKKNRLKYLKQQLIYYKNLGREDWVSNTQKEIESLASQIASTDEGVDYPNDGESKGRK